MADVDGDTLYVLIEAFDLLLGELIGLRREWAIVGRLWPVESVSVQPSRKKPFGAFDESAVIACGGTQTDQTVVNVITDFNRSEGRPRFSSAEIKSMCDAGNDGRPLDMNVNRSPVTIDLTWLPCDH